MRLPEPYGNGAWQLYQSPEDPGAMKNLATQYSDLTMELTQSWKRYAKTNGVIHPNRPVPYARPVSGGKF